MRQWEIYKFPLPNPEQPHYCVVLSADAVCLEPTLTTLNLLICTTLRPANRSLNPWEVLVDEADGFSHKTVVNCLAIYLSRKVDARDPLGAVSPTRRRAIARKVIDCFRLQA